MAAAFEVYNEIGYGMAEEIYQQSEDQRRFVFRCLWKEELVFQQEGFDFMADRNTNRR